LIKLLKIKSKPVKFFGRDVFHFTLYFLGFEIYEFYLEVEAKDGTLTWYMKPWEGNDAKPNT